MRWWFAVLAVAACGRVGFEPADGGVDALSDAGIDALNPACLVSDGVCVFGCGGIDVDCATTCGDGTCVGNGGELCGNCAADCMTQRAACGNGACDPGEVAAGCIADCGPAPWPWTKEETELLTMVNATRDRIYVSERSGSGSRRTDRDDVLARSPRVGLGAGAPGHVHRGRHRV